MISKEIFEKVLNKWFIRGKDEGRKYASRYLESHSSYSQYSGIKQIEKLRSEAWIIARNLLKDSKRLNLIKADIGFQKNRAGDYIIIYGEEEESLKNLADVQNIYEEGFYEGWKEFFGIGYDLERLFEMEEF